MNRSVTTARLRAVSLNGSHDDNHDLPRMTRHRICGSTGIGCQCRGGLIRASHRWRSSLGPHSVSLQASERTRKRRMRRAVALAGTYASLLNGERAPPIPQPHRRLPSGARFNVVSRAPSTAVPYLCQHLNCVIVALSQESEAVCPGLTARQTLAHGGRPGEST
jgi:hypothetical protein